MKTKTHTPHFLIAFAAVLFLGQGCVRPAIQETAPLPPAPPEQPATPSEQPINEPGDTPPPLEQPPKELPSSNDSVEASSYEDFSEEKFQQALQEGKPVYLYFFASWCPTCREQNPRNEQIVPNHPGGIVGFRAHTLDNQTSDVEKRYASEYNVFLQHTAIYFKDGQEAFRRIGTQSNAQLQNDLTVISQ